MDPSSFFAAVQRRAGLVAGGSTNAVRLIDGIGDGPQFAGIILEDYADRWLVQTDDRHVAEPPGWLQTASQPRSIYWKRLEKSDRSAPVHWHGEVIDAPFEILENGLRYRIDFSAGYSQGIFLDQRDNRSRMRDLARRDTTMLNLFSYTCAFSVAAAMRGAIATSVDLSKRYLDWGRENFRANQMDPGMHEFHAGDVFDRLQLFTKQARRFDLIVVDPPTFSRDRDGNVFRVEDDYPRLARQSVALLAANGRLLCCTNHRGIPPQGLRRMLESTLGPGWGFESVDMPPDFTGEKYLQSVWARRTD